VTPAAEFPSARFEVISRDQSVLHAIDVERLVDENHPARNIWDFIGTLNLDRFLSDVAAVEGRAGRSRWEPRLLLSMWLYALHETAYRPGDLAVPVRKRIFSQLPVPEIRTKSEIGNKSV